MEKEQVPEEGVEVPIELLAPDILDKFIQDFILRAGTDYGTQEATLERKMNDIRTQLKRGDLKIVFDLASETGSIVSSSRSQR